MLRYPKSYCAAVECCSSYPETPIARPLTRANAAYNAQTIQALFLRVRGLVSLTAAEPGDGATSLHVGANPGQAGSAFTVALLRLMCNENRTYARWGELYPHLQQETADASSIQGSPAHRAHAFRIEETKVAR